MRKILVLHGPNLNLLGQREPLTYGNQTIKELNTALEQEADRYQMELDIFQSNHEGSLIDKVHHANENKTTFIIINPAGLTHTSVVLRDALAAVAIPFIEVHISNIYKRESFRHRSMFSDLAKGTICGLGTQGYLLAMAAAYHHFNT